MDRAEKAARYYISANTLVGTSLDGDAAPCKCPKPRCPHSGCGHTSLQLRALEGQDPARKHAQRHIPFTHSCMEKTWLEEHSTAHAALLSFPAKASPACLQFLKDQNRTFTPGKAFLVNGSLLLLPHAHTPCARPKACSRPSACSHHTHTEHTLPLSIPSRLRMSVGRVLR